MRAETHRPKKAEQKIKAAQQIKAGHLIVPSPGALVLSHNINIKSKVERDKFTSVSKTCRQKGCAVNCQFWKSSCLYEIKFFKKSTMYWSDLCQNKILTIRPLLHTNHNHYTDKKPRKIIKSSHKRKKITQRDLEQHLLQTGFLKIFCYR